VPAVSAALAFRIVNYWLAIGVGWLSVGFLAHQSRRRARVGPTTDSAAGSVVAVADPEPSE
jgi:hypothetical protein